MRRFPILNQELRSCLGRPSYVLERCKNRRPLGVVFSLRYKKTRADHSCLSNRHLVEFDVFVLSMLFYIDLYSDNIYIDEITFCSFAGAALVSLQLPLSRLYFVRN